MSNLSLVLAVKRETRACGSVGTAYTRVAERRGLERRDVVEAFLDYDLRRRDLAAKRWDPLQFLLEPVLGKQRSTQFAREWRAKERSNGGAAPDLSVENAQQRATSKSNDTPETPVK